jgi:hypothetical protein
VNLQCDGVAVFVGIRPVDELARKKVSEVFSDGLLSDGLARLHGAIVKFCDNIDVGLAYYPLTISGRMAKHRRTFKTQIVVKMYFHCETSLARHPFSVQSNLSVFRPTPQLMPENRLATVLELFMGSSGQLEAREPRQLFEKVI